jgi:tRNA-binding protein
MITWSDFEKLEILAGTIVDAQPFPEARKPAIKLTIDFGKRGILKSSAQITDHYTSEGLMGKQVIAVTNFPPKQIANFISECLVLGVYDQDHRVVLLSPDQTVYNGARIG